MRTSHPLPLFWLTLAATAAVSQPTLAAHAQDNSKPAVAQAASRASAYFHAAMAGYYEEQATNSGRPEFAQHAIEEYKAALNADPGSAPVYDALADLYLRTGKPREAESTAREVLKSSPDDIEAHKLLGRIYLRRLGEQQNGVSSSSPSGNTLELATAEYEKIVALQPKSLESRMVLGQLYTVAHQTAKAEEQFNVARAMEPESEEVVLDLARVYGENGDFDHAAKTIEAVPESDRSGRMEFTLGATYEQLKRLKDAIAAYGRAVQLQPDDAATQNALGQALLADGQLDAALKQYKQISAADPEDAMALVRISEIQRRQGKYDDALVTIRKARKKDPDNLEAGYNEGLLLDVLGHYDEAATAFDSMVDKTSHANGAYTTDEKNNRGIFLERLGSVYHEQNKIDQAVATYQKMVEMGGETATQGYQSQVDVYNDARMFDKAVEVSRQAVAANPKSVELKVMLAGELIDEGKTEEGLAMARGLLKNTEDDRKIYFALANMNTRLHRWKDAHEAIDKAAPLTTKKEDRLYLLFLRGALADREKHLEQAEQCFHDALEIDPSNSMTLNYLGYMLADKGVRLPEALKFIRKAVEIDPMNGAFLDSLGWAYFKLGEYELAEENLRRAVERDPSDPTVHDHLGDLYEKTGRIRLAAAQWEISVAQYAKTPIVDVEPGDVAKVQHKLEGAHVRLARQDSVAAGTKSE